MFDLVSELSPLRGARGVGTHKGPLFSHAVLLVMAASLWLLRGTSQLGE